MHLPASVFGAQTSSLRMIKSLVAKAFPTGKFKVSRLPKEGAMPVIITPGGVLLSEDTVLMPRASLNLTALITSTKVGALGLLVGLIKDKGWIWATVPPSMLLQESL